MVITGGDHNESVQAGRHIGFADVIVSPRNDSTVRREDDIEGSTSRLLAGWTRTRQADLRSDGATGESRQTPAAYQQYAGQFGRN
ncbi:MAG: hypothetical protein JO020_29105 [Chloroflexi bacterium]|nr:hypothetical protein [Chloroflexota bacterium]MBV9898234.1 hypothetical protein [Chloroflexota bacterium]